MRRGFIQDVKEVFAAAIDNLYKTDHHAAESERIRIERLRRDVISDLYKLHRVEKALQDPPAKREWHSRNKINSDYDDRRNYNNKNDYDEYEYDDDDSRPEK